MTKSPTMNENLKDEQYRPHTWNVILEYNEGYGKLPQLSTISSFENELSYKSAKRSVRSVLESSFETKLIGLA